MKMVRIVRVVSLAVLWCNASAWAGCDTMALASGMHAAQIVSLAGRGETWVPSASGWELAKLSQQLDAGTDMRTLALSSAALLLADRTQIRMASNARLRLCQVSEERTVLDLMVGRLWARTKKTPATLELQTPAAVAAVRGTDWDVEVDEAGRTTLTVLSGSITLSNAHGTVELSPSEQGYVEPGKAPVKRLLIRPRDRVQWVMANPLDVTRWAQLQPGELTPWLQEVRADLERGDGVRARDRLTAAAADGTGSAVVELMLADLDVFDGRLDAAQRRLQRVWLRTHDPRTAARRADLLMAMDQGDAAREWLDVTQAQAPQSSALALADADWYRLQGSGGQALERYHQAMKLAQGSAQQAVAAWGLGRALQERGDVAAARPWLARAVALAPQNATYLSELATASAQALHLSDARNGFEQALTLSGDDYVGMAGLGLLALQRGDAVAARTWLLKALVIEPRYARAQVWLALAEYSLGGRGAALDSLDRARLADPNDPMPWQMQAMMQNDSGEPVEAMAAARQALIRLPYLKSLNPLASDSQGSANLGKALGDFGLEHWARAYAGASYYPLWAGSHFFMADRYESDFNRKSELFQGYLSDPTVFGASDKRAPLLLSTGSEWTAGISAERSPLRQNGTADIGVRGFDASTLPVAWLVRANNVEMWPGDGPPSSRYRLSSPGVDLALGLRPSEQLSMFLLHGDTILNYRFPQGLDFGNGITFSTDAQTRNQRTDLGASWRWSADSQTWLKVHGAKQTSSLTLDDARYGPQHYRFSSDENGVYLRHAGVRGEWRWSLGWEGVDRDTVSTISDAQIATPRVNTERYRMPWVAIQWQHAPWSAMAEAYWPRFSTQQSDRYTDTQDQDMLAPQLDGAEISTRLLPRFGLSYAFSPARALHYAYQESLRAPGTHTLAPVATGAIAIDNQYLLTGSFSRKHAMQLDWEFSQTTFGMLGFSTQSITNPVAQTGRLFAQNTSALFDNISTIAPVVINGKTTLNTYEVTPVFGKGELQHAHAAVDHVLSPRWSVLGHYTYTASRNTGAAFVGLLLPGFARHVLLGQTTWRHSARGFSLLRLTWRGQRYQDEANLIEKSPDWNLALATGWESSDRRWSVTGTLQTSLNSSDPPSVWMLLRWRN